jgi:uncharacterized protein (TIGR00375 family)
MITCEVSTIFSFEGSVKKIHHVILTPNLEIAEQINDRLNPYGKLQADGRPILKMSASHLVEEIMEVSHLNLVFPAHVWTPWFSLFGIFGFNSVKDCYKDMTKYIHVLETGLSSDPPMNWRISALDKYKLVSNSDCHSSWPWRIGREANVFELKKLDYFGIINALTDKDNDGLKFTIETNPAYGKYHWSGHRKCDVSFSPNEALRFRNICPICRKELTKGVEQRVEEFADRPVGFKPKCFPDYKRLLPLSEIISEVLGISYPGAKKVWEVYNLLISTFGNEYRVLLEVPFEDMAKVVNPKVVEAIINVRENRVKVIPGYDGVYGKLVIFPQKKKRVSNLMKDVERPKQRQIIDFV